jgi:hypothetical protein
LRPRHWLAAVLMVVAACPTRADGVTDQINEALKAYQNHDTQTAIAALDAAGNLLRQSRADKLKALLPSVPPGWTADDAQSSAVGVALLGGGITASRAYRNGSQRVEVQIITDSPMLQAIAALLRSPLGEVGGMQTVVVGGRRMSYTENDPSYTTLVADKVIVKIDGNSATPDATLKSFIGAIDFDAMEKLAR